MDSRYAEAYANRGLARRATSSIAAAISDFEKALDVAPVEWSYRGTVQAWLQATRSEKKE
jgi:hypothetical protein